jgi:hypothetical protein
MIAQFVSKTSLSIKMQIVAALSRNRLTQTEPRILDPTASQLSNSLELTPYAKILIPQGLSESDSMKPSTQIQSLDLSLTPNPHVTIARSQSALSSFKLYPLHHNCLSH